MHDGLHGPGRLSVTSRWVKLSASVLHDWRLGMIAKSVEVALNSVHAANLRPHFCIIFAFCYFSFTYSQRVMSNEAHIIQANHFLCLGRSYLVRVLFMLASKRRHISFIPGKTFTHGCLTKCLMPSSKKKCKCR